MDAFCVRKIRTAIFKKCNSINYMHTAHFITEKSGVAQLWHRFLHSTSLSVFCKALQT
jgi:hypothetical protein